MNIRLARQLAALWGFVGVTLFLGFAVVRLSHHALAIFEMQLTLFQWGLVAANCIFMAYSEGYKGFQNSFSPRTAARIRYISQHATWKTGLLAPVFCFGYFGINRRKQVGVILLSLMIVVLIMIVSQLSQPWRGIVDSGVVVGLVWGITSLFVYTFKAFTQKDFPYSAELPEAATIKS